MLYVVNSRSRISGTNEDFTYSIKIPQDANRVVVMSALIPKSYYLVREGYNWFNIKVGITNWFSTRLPIEIPAGNYNRLSFQKVLEAKVNEKIVLVMIPQFKLKITWPDSESDVSTGHYRYDMEAINHISDANEYIIFEFPKASESNIHELMGFDPDRSYEFKYDSVDTVHRIIESTNVIKMQKEDCLLLQSNIVDNLDSNKENTVSVMQEIYCGGGFSSYSNIIYQNMGNMEGYARPIRKGSDIFKFWLSNEDYQTIDLNGLNFVFTLKFLP